MKLSKETIAILKNFAQINGNLLIKPGSKLATISATNSIYATATVNENFTEQFGIYDANEFLGALSLFNDPDITFSNKFATIKEGRNSIRYFSADESVLKTPPNGVKFPAVDVDFELSADQLGMLLKTSGVLRVSDVTFTGDGSTIIASIGDKKNTTGNSYSVEVGETTETFAAHFNIDNFKFIPGSYKVELSSKRISRFSNGDLTYVVSMEADSTF